ncbi:MAG: hypothetical protein GWN55_16660 [Phycisphaerae bacterium]|nr:hypothetical protein [Gammaproteobacteria bacterium]NIR27680.1 hypothetical protein [Gammaproteobacteria bacterium]NIV02921.1 hypothetical protein [Phycisphaerae bacterium]NIV70521.1 hypothetical protein [Phycisphaerae bacterium]NIY19566.1 hypothetical protein [Gammaproteobacteria bacterium]
MKITRILSDEDGESHFEEIDIPLKDAGDIGALSETFPVTGIIFRETDGDYDYNWHNAPCRQFILMLDGSVEIEVSDGSRKTFHTGDILLAEDTTGRGHISRAVNKQPRKSVFVTLE